MTISAVIPTYNRRVQLHRAIDSVLAQSAPVDEIIVVDDGSEDGTAEATRARYGSRVAVFSQLNAGPGAARNRGIREARSEWIAFLDSDDQWLPGKTERQIQVLSALGDGFGLCFTDCVYHGGPEGGQTRFREVGFAPAAASGPLAEPVQWLSLGKEPFHIQTLLVLRSLLLKAGGFDEAIVLGDDTDMTFRLAFATRFCFAAEALVRIDRAPSRNGLMDLFRTRDDRKYQGRIRMYSQWLAMPEVAGTAFEAPIREALISLCYSSAEAKFHELRFGPALREIERLKEMGESVPAIATTIAARKIRKLAAKFGFGSAGATCAGVERA